VSEEYSVGLMAFNEAIDGFNPEINGNFTNYCNMVVNHRIIDYIRKTRNTAMSYLSHILKKETISKKISRLRQPLPL